MDSQVLTKEDGELFLCPQRIKKLAKNPRQNSNQGQLIFQMIPRSCSSGLLNHINIFYIFYNQMIIVNITFGNDNQRFQGRILGKLKSGAMGNVNPANVKLALQKDRPFLMNN